MGGVSRKGLDELAVKQVCLLVSGWVSTQGLEKLLEDHCERRADSPG